MPTYLVTGAAGFIGSNLVRALLERKEKVRGIDNFITGHRKNIEGLDHLDFVEGDVTDEGTLRQVIAGVDYVLHQAAIPSVPRSVDQPLASHHANTTGTLHVLETARQSGTVKRVVYASSSSAYGDTPTLPKVETMPTQPRSPYAVSKLAGEQYASVYSHVFRLECVSLRYFNIFGPRQDPSSHYAAVIPKFIECALQRQPPPVFGDGKQSRDFTHVENAVEANLKACTAPDVAGETFNVACGQSYDLLTLVHEINDILGTDVHPEHLPPRRGDVRD
ncbi:NAD-dependent epimerase/dehydratase family protein, partial [Myxococcota bacterium]